MSLTFEEYRKYDGYGLAQLVAQGELQSQELIEVAIARFESVQGEINALTYNLPADKVEKGQPNSVFSGVPFLLKDLCLDIPSMPTSNGCEPLKSYFPKQSNNLVSRYLSSGVRIFGKTNTPEFGLMGVTEPDAFGASRNPWDLSLSPGGSSGGSAAAIAAGIVPMAAGGDGGGSLRIPASCCGLFGFKPSRGQVPSGPEVGEYWQGAMQQHVMTRSVRDCALMLDVISGNDTGSPFIVKENASFYNNLDEPIGSLKIGVCLTSPMDTNPNKDIKQVIEKFASELESLGHRIEFVQRPYDGELLLKSYLGLYNGEVAADIELTEQLLNRKLAFKELEVTTWVLAKLGEKQSAKEAVLLRRNWNQLARSMGRFHQDYDLLLTPVLSQSPPKIAALKPSSSEQNLLKILYHLGMINLVEKTGLFNKVAEKNLSVMPYTQIANLTGQPAMSVPLWLGNSLPMGAQFIAANGNDHVLFQLASQIEKALPWFDKVPKL